MNKRKLLPVLVASVLALGCIGAFAFADGDSGSSNTAYLATGTDSSVQIDQLYDAEVEENLTDVIKVQVSWELENIAASVTVNKIWDTTELKWVEDSSNPNTATATDVTAEFNFKNLSSIKVLAQAEFEAESTFGEITPAFTDNGVTEGDGIITLGTKANSKSAVNEGKIEATITPDADKFKTFTTEATDAKYGTYTVTISKLKANYLKFTATKDGSSVTPKFDSGTWQYSTDNGETWNDGTNDGTTTIALAKDESVVLKGENCVTGAYNYFSMTGEIAASGSVTSLTDGNGGDPNVVLSKACYAWMFNDCVSLTKAPELPATTLTADCYWGMFMSCKALTAAPKLPARTLARYCYGSMFYQCEGITTMPELPATNLAEYCYNCMFDECYNLTNLSKLPATVLVKGCYSYMFQNCVYMTKAPEICAKTLDSYACSNMFVGDYNLKISDSDTSGGTLFFECPDTTGLDNPVGWMFHWTAGEYTSDPVAGNKYYWYVEKN